MLDRMWCTGRALYAGKTLRWEECGVRAGSWSAEGSTDVVSSELSNGAARGRAEHAAVLGAVSGSKGSMMACEL